MAFIAVVQTHSTSAITNQIFEALFMVCSSLFVSSCVNG